MAHLQSRIFLNSPLTHWPEMAPIHLHLWNISDASLCIEILFDERGSNFLGCFHSYTCFIIFYDKKNDALHAEWASLTTLFNKVVNKTHFTCGNKLRLVTLTNYIISKPNCLVCNIILWVNFYNFSNFTINIRACYRKVGYPCWAKRLLRTFLVFDDSQKFRT